MKRDWSIVQCYSHVTVVYNDHTYDKTAIAEKHNSCDGAFFSDGTTSYRPGPVVSHTLRNQLEMCWLSRLDLPSPHTVLVPPSSCAACSYTWLMPWH